LRKTVLFKEPEFVDPQQQQQQQQQQHNNYRRTKIKDLGLIPMVM